ncbi:MAG: tetratricopeptide repeat protein [Pseudomonadota bacterium]
MRIPYCTTAALIAATLAFGGTQAVAQDSRQTLFDALYDAPGDRDLMLRYARAAVAEGDFEAAVATLERLIDQEPSNQDARLELAKGYFALGQNTLASYHLDIYLQRGDLTPSERDAATALAREAADRDDGFEVSGTIEAGAVRSSELGETGLAYRAGARLRWDLGGARPHTWDANVHIAGRFYDSGAASDSHRFVLRTGPRFLLSDQPFGPQLQPYIELASVDDDDIVEQGDRVMAGLYYAQPLSTSVALFADLAYGTQNRDTGAGDADVLRVSLGAEVWPSEQIKLRFLLLHQDENADAGGIDRDRDTVRLDATYYFSSGLSRVDRDWELQAFVQLDNESASGGVEDDYRSYGAALKAYVRRDTFVRFTARRVDRDSTSFGQSRDDTVVSLTAGWEF